jgi:hypothetical protein
MEAVADMANFWRHMAIPGSDWDMYTKYDRMLSDIQRQIRCQAPMLEELEEAQASMPDDNGFKAISWL